MDPHSYQPVVVDESCLTDEERREAFEKALHGSAGGESGGDWRSYATPQELAKLEKELAELPKLKSPFISADEAPGVTEKQFELTLRCRLRGYARRKYNGGHRVWYGDGTFRSTTG
jgi:hypothetical protein